MSNIWLHRKLTLINVINDITETDYDDINLSIVLNVLWTVDGEEQTYLMNTLRNMISGDFDEKSYSKSFLEQLDLICTIPVSIPAAETEQEAQEETAFDHDELEDEIEDETIETDVDVEDDLDDEDLIEVPQKGIRNIGLIFSISSFLMAIVVFMQRDTFSFQAVIDALPHWAYFWLELFLVVIVLVAVSCMIKNIARKIAEQIATLGYLILFLPFLWILKGFEFSSAIHFIVTGALLFAVILSFSRICSHNTLK